MVAAFFAAEEPRGEKICVWAIKESILFPRASKEIGFDNIGIHLIKFHERDNHYLFAQKGLFSDIQNSTQYFLGRGKWPDLETVHAFLDEPILTKLTLPSAEAKSLIGLLDREGISRAQLTPSYDNAAKAAIKGWS
ncbi:hypothetical protein ASD32_05175 [Rhizobium sp. Root483D2]|nr:hypothetical protein ASD32_05175 [Rhizobium sp. Root483D2]